ncbi:CheR family methyltransferase [Kamptonema formosum]|uniref:CheR family methyltransferase n=1 Tax=Kamptonema formosum TaxID=331992 RepID=UPI0003483FC5|nr:CheR family methyltransferase [Oscillatoria sp. PCC 10802]
MSSAPPDPAFEALLDYLKRARGFDFTGYKRPSLMRLMKKRMQKVQVTSFSEYLDYLEVHPLEFSQLFNSLLLNVTAFFRDKSAWDYLSEEIVPRILGSKNPDDPIRVWSAGCGSGKEAYTLAIVLAEALGADAFRTRVKIYATDLDDEAVTDGRSALYTEKDIQPIPPELRSKYFETVAAHYTFRSDLRRAVIFGRHDLVQDPPISRLDLLVCRNTLMYFNAETQARILARFHFALNNTGFLFVGKAEMLLTHANLFAPVNLKYRIFAKVPQVSMRDRLLLMAQNSPLQIGNQLEAHMRLRDEAFDTLESAYLVVDSHGYLAMVSRQARALFGLTFKDLGRPLQDLEVSYRPVELRSKLQQVYAERRPVLVSDVEFLFPDGNAVYLDITLTPLVEASGALLGARITFTDVTRYHHLQQELFNSQQELETAYQELQASNEELETTNEELQSTNEELETTNEELQSTNEELETINEELQSTNEELETMNEELRQRTDELNHVNRFLEAILGSLRVGIAVLDDKLSIHLWNGQAEDLWGVRAEEVQGHFFLNLDTGLPVAQLRDIIRTCQAGTAQYQELIVGAVNRRGKSIRCRVSCTPLIGMPRAPLWVIVLMEEISDPPA